MLVNIDKKIEFDKLELLVYCYVQFRALDDSEFRFTVESLLEELNIADNDRNWQSIHDAISTLERYFIVFSIPADADIDTYVVMPYEYGADKLFYQLHKDEFDLLKDNRKLLHYFCWIISHLETKIKSFPMSNLFIEDGYIIKGKTIKKYNDDLNNLKLLSVTTEIINGRNTTNLYKRLLTDENLIKIPDDIAIVKDEEVIIKINQIINKVKDFFGIIDDSLDKVIERCIESSTYSADEILCELNCFDFERNYGWLISWDGTVDMMLRIRILFNQIQSAMEQTRTRRFEYAQREEKEKRRIKFDYNDFQKKYRGIDWQEYVQHEEYLKNNDEMILVSTWFIDPADLNLIDMMLQEKALQEKTEGLVVIQ